MFARVKVDWAMTTRRRTRAGFGIAALVGSSVGWGLAPGCSVAFEGGECRSSEECAGSLECAAPDAPQVCGIPATEECATDEDCGGGEMRCHAYPDPCSPDGVGSRCQIACSEGSCGEGFRCNDAGACEVVPCDEGYACPSYQTCDPSVPASGPVFDRAHGCVAIECADDGDCSADGACVHSVCQSGPGSCVEPELTP